MKTFLSTVSAVVLVSLSFVGAASAQVPYRFVDYGDSVSFSGPDGDVTVWQRRGGPTCGYGDVSWDDLRSYLGTLDFGRVILQTESCGDNLIVCVGEQWASAEICYVSRW